MKTLLKLSAVTAALGFVSLTLPASALPVPAGIASSAGQADFVHQARMSRRHRMRMRQGSASRGNAAMPSRGARGQQYGGTTGGPRR